MTTSRAINPDWRRKSPSVRKLSSRERGQRGLFERAQAAGWKPGPFATPGDAQAFLDKATSDGEQPRDERGRFASNG